MPTRPTLYDDKCDVIFELNGDAHANLHEATAIVAEAARRGTSTEGARVFIGGAPCPNCADQLIAAGVAAIYHRHEPRLSASDRLAMVTYLLAKGVDLIEMLEGDFQ